MRKLVKENNVVRIYNVDGNECEYPVYLNDNKYIMLNKPGECRPFLELYTNDKNEIFIFDNFYRVIYYESYTANDRVSYLFTHPLETFEYPSDDRYVISNNITHHEYISKMNELSKEYENTAVDYDAIRFCTDLLLSRYLESIGETRIIELYKKIDKLIV